MNKMKCNMKKKKKKKKHKWALSYIGRMSLCVIFFKKVYGWRLRSDTFEVGSFLGEFASANRK